MYFLLFGIFSTNDLFADGIEKKNEEIYVNSNSIIGFFPLELVEDSVFNLFYGKKITEQLATIIPFSIKNKATMEPTNISDNIKVPLFGFVVGLTARYQLLGTLFDEGIYFETRGKLSMLKSSSKYRASLISGIIECVLGSSLELASDLYIETSILMRANFYKRIYHSQRMETGKYYSHDFQMSIFSSA